MILFYGGIKDFFRGAVSGELHDQRQAYGNKQGSRKAAKKIKSAHPDQPALVTRAEAFDRSAHTHPVLVNSVGHGRLLVVIQGFLALVVLWLMLVVLQSLRLV